MKPCMSKKKNTISKKLHQNTMQLKDILSCLYNKRCSSAKNSPYISKTSIERLKCFIETTSRQKSPRLPSPKLKQKSGKKPIKSEFKKKSIKSSTKRRENYLVELNTTKNIEYAPVLYQNQLFRDVYDSQGNHDRLLITPRSSINLIQDESCLIPGILILPKDQSLSQTSDTNLKQPNNSQILDAGLPKDFNALLLEKLSKIQS